MSWQKIHHVSQFNNRWFKDVSLLIGCRLLENYVISWASFPHDCMPILTFPHMIGFKIKRAK